MQTTYESATTYHVQELEPHLGGPDPEAAGPEPVDDDLGRGRDVEAGLLDGRHVVVDHVLRFLGVLPGEEEHLGPDGLRRGWQHVQVVEGSVVVEAAQVPVANGLLVSTFPERKNFIGSQVRIALLSFSDIVML